MPMRRWSALHGRPNGAVQPHAGDRRRASTLARGPAVDWPGHPFPFDFADKTASTDVARRAQCTGRRPTANLRVASSCSPADGDRSAAGRRGTHQLLNGEGNQRSSGRTSRSRGSEPNALVSAPRRQSIRRARGQRSPSQASKTPRSRENRTHGRAAIVPPSAGARTALGGFRPNGRDSTSASRDKRGTTRDASHQRARALRHRAYGRHPARGDACGRESRRGRPVPERRGGRVTK